ncbi:MAG: hypothetical protein AAB676_06970 [Verrucomicrobiota bacterium]
MGFFHKAPVVNAKVHSDGLAMLATFISIDPIPSPEFIFFCLAREGHSVAERSLLGGSRRAATRTKPAHCLLLIPASLTCCRIGFTPGGLTCQWQDEMLDKFGWDFDLVNRASFEAKPTCSPGRAMACLSRLLMSAGAGQ